MIKDHVVGVQRISYGHGVDHSLRENDLCLTKAIDICKAAEDSTKRLEKLTDKENLKTTGPACQSCGRNHTPRRYLEM